MSYVDNAYQSPSFAVADASVDDRADFITKTYLHLAGAVGVFVGIEFALLNSPFAEMFMRALGNTRFSWLIVLGGFMFVSWIANSWARSSTSLGMQYAGLSLYVVAEAIIFVPLLYMASRAGGGGVIPTAGIATGVLFLAMTAIVFITRKDFSFLRSILMFGGFAAMGLIAVAVICQFSLGPIFTYAMIAFACGYILYDTSNVLHHYRIGQHVAASLSLFASVALLFWYIVQLFMSRD